jgi:hypothetical protein
MRTILGKLLRALIIAVAWGAIGVGVNFISAKPVPWTYEPPSFLDLGGVKVQLIEEKQAMNITAYGIVQQGERNVSRMLCTE